MTVLCDVCMRPDAAHSAEEMANCESSDPHKDHGYRSYLLTPEEMDERDNPW